MGFTVRASRNPDHARILQIALLTSQEDRDPSNWNEWSRELIQFRKLDFSSIYVAEVDLGTHKKMVGYVMVIADAYGALIYRMAVDPDYQRQGVGRKMFRHVVNRIIKPNQRIRLAIHTPSDIQSAFIWKMGMRMIQIVFEGCSSHKNRVFVFSYVKKSKEPKT